MWHIFSSGVRYLVSRIKSRDNDTESADRRINYEGNGALRSTDVAIGAYCSKNKIYCHLSHPTIMLIKSLTKCTCGPRADQKQQYITTARRHLCFKLATQVNASPSCHSKHNQVVDRQTLTFYMVSPPDSYTPRRLQQFVRRLSTTHHQQRYGAVPREASGGPLFFVQQRTD